MPESDEARVAAHLEKVTPAKRRRDAHTLLRLYRDATGRDPYLWGSIVGFGHYDYRYASGRSGRGPAAAFAPRKNAAVVYLSDGVGAHAAALERLGEHRVGVGCLYLRDLEEVDLRVLGEIVADSYRALSAGVWTGRARDAGPDA